MTLSAPADGALFSFGDTVPFQVTVSDPEVGTIDCSRVRVRYLLGHDSHEHEITSKTGCSGTITTPVDGEHDAAANIYGVLDAEYTDNGDWISFTPYVLSGAGSFTARVSSGGAGGTLEVRAGSATGTLLGSAAVANTGGWDTFVTVNGTLGGAPAGSTQLFLVFTGATGQGNLFDLDAFTLNPGRARTARTVEGEAWTSTGGVQAAAHDGDAGGVRRVG